MRLRSLPLLALSFGLVACPGSGSDTDGSTTDSTTAGPTTEPSTEGTAGTETAGPTTTEDEPTAGTTGEPGGDLNPHTLGDHASQGCIDAMAGAATFLAATAEFDADAAAAAYTDALKIYVQALDTANERDDDSAITAALADADGPGAALAEGHLYTSLMFQLRANLSAVETGAEDKYAAWDEAHCVWDGGLRSLAERAQAEGWTGAGDPIVADIDAAFAAGHDGLSGEPPSTAGDDWRIPPNKQIIEKTLFRAAHRDIVGQSIGATMAVDAARAARALGVFGIVRDRLQDRNTPGIAVIEAMLAGDPAMISGSLIAVEMDKAFAKRTRNYADQAFSEGLGIPPSYKGAVEGRTYAKLIVAGMGSAMMNTEAYLADWEEYAELVRTGDDEAAAQEVSQRLIDATCAYQTALGIAACTGSDDET
ncbi:hypothetical protein [Nannocystis bainbridge]|uniref:Uncharacterized protein n=1 Tax=Nannocystis bainbridge TaxID=2995303 RepID=A0ABT5DNQ5_9BACT|nr:hypothetical protein [Nannocystis bainbridge]MDC0715285.1 hypothetical protein [Nannocystis bainbridge]